MSVKIVQGLVNTRSGYQEIKTGSAQSRSTTPLSTGTSVLQQSISLGAQAAVGKSLSDAVVSSVRGGKSAGSSEKIREFHEAREVSSEVAEKIRDGDGATEAHDGLDDGSGTIHLA